MKIVKILPILILLSILTGCQQAPKDQLITYIEEAKQVVKNTNWDNMETVIVEFNEYSFTPSNLTFKKGTPYKLEMKNVGTEKHYFVSEDFYKSIATRKVQSNSDGEIKAPYFSALEVFPGRQLDLYFVPMEEGSFRLICTIEGHEEQGMHGTIVIE